MAIFDTDILIWIERGNTKAARLIDTTEERYISIQTYMELMQCAKSKHQHKITREFLHDYNFQLLPLTENIGHRAAIYIEEYTLSSGLRAGDALVAATAIEHDLTLVTSNYKHFKVIQELQLHNFRP